MRVLLLSSVLAASTSEAVSKGRLASLEELAPRQLKPENVSNDNTPYIPVDEWAYDEEDLHNHNGHDQALVQHAVKVDEAESNSVNNNGDGSTLDGLLPASIKMSTQEAVDEVVDAKAKVNEALVAAMNDINNNGDRSALDGLGGNESETKEGKNFKEWFTTIDSHSDGSNDVDFTVDTSGELTQNGIELNGGIEQNNRFCGITYDHAVDTHCSSAPSCQFQKCPGGMNCYVLSESVMLNWCDELESVVSSEPTEVWIEMPVEKPTLSPSLAPVSPTNNPTLVPVTASPITKSPTAEPSFSPTWTPTLTPTGAPVINTPSKNPTTSPTEAPTYLPSDAPTLAPVTASPTMKPTAAPSNKPTTEPTTAPTYVPSDTPTKNPVTSEPTRSPTPGPTASPTYVPSEVPTKDPTIPPFTASPTESPSNNPTYFPSAAPTNAPVSSSPTTKAPTKDPTIPPFTSNPSKNPTESPSYNPTYIPSAEPTNAPVTAAPSSNKPTEKPMAISLSSNALLLRTIAPSSSPVSDPTDIPASNPASKSPTAKLSNGPTNNPTTTPTKFPTKHPTIPPFTSNPSETTSTMPSVESTEVPSKTESEFPSVESTGVPSNVVSEEPSKTEFPSVMVSGTPSTAPSSARPTVSPSHRPTTASPTASPSNKPTTVSPTTSPSKYPITSSPTKSPSTHPSHKGTTASQTSGLTPSPSTINLKNPFIRTVSPTASPSTLTTSPTKNPITSSPTKSPTEKPITATPTSIPTKSPSKKPITATPSMSPSNDPTVKSWMTWTTTPPSLKGTTALQTSGLTPSPSSINLKNPFLRTVLPTASPSTLDPTQSPSVTASPITPKIPFLRTISPSAVIETTLSPSVSPLSATLHPNDKFMKFDPTISPSDVPTNGPGAGVSTQLPSAGPTETKEPVTVDFPKLDYVLLTTDAEISRGAVEQVGSAVQTFLSAELAVYYGKSFSEIQIEAVDAQTALREVDDNSIGQRHLAEVNGTAISFVGDVNFKGKEPTGSELTEALISIGEEHNKYLVSNITSTGHEQLQAVVVVLVESTPTQAPSEWVEDFVRTPDAVVGGVETAPDTSKTSIIIASICGITALTMLLFVFATRNRAPATGEDEEEVIANAKSQLTEPQILPGMIDVDSTQASFGISRNPNIDAGFDLNDNEESLTIMSSVTDWNDYPTISKERSNSITLGAQVEVVNGSRSHEDVVATWTPDGKSLQSAAALNNIATRTLEKNDESVVPKFWSAAKTGKDAPTRLSLGAVSSAHKEEDSDSDESSQGNGESIGGFFPTARRSLEGSFPTAKNVRINSREFATTGAFCGAEAIYNDLDSSIDHSTNYSAVGSRYDWSHIGTVDDALEEDYSCQSKSSASAAAESVPSLSKIPSQDTKDTSSSLNRFISDLVWLEKKITDESDAAKVREAIELTLKESAIEQADSYSYQCDSFSPRSMSEDEDATTISSRQGSQPMSIICRDVFIPPGDLRIEIMSTMDGPMINRVQEELNGHLCKGDLIIAVDDSDTRAYSAEEVKAIITLKSNLERKLTVLQFGGSSSVC